MRGETAVGWVDEDEARGGIDPDGDPEAEVETECCWRFLARVGVNSGPESKERNREDRRDSSLSSWKVGAVRYVTERERLPAGCGTEGKLWGAGRCCALVRCLDGWHQME